MTLRRKLISTLMMAISMQCRMPRPSQFTSLSTSTAARPAFRAPNGRPLVARSFGFSAFPSIDPRGPRPPPPPPPQSAPRKELVRRPSLSQRRRRRDDDNEAALLPACSVSRRSFSHSVRDRMRRSRSKKGEQDGNEDDEAGDQRRCVRERAERGQQRPKRE